jgi:acetolactate synthase-1/2/3 large subunit
MIADHIGAPIGLTINAKGAVPGDHPLCVASRMMFTPLDRLFLDADVVLVLGSQLSDLDWWMQPQGFNFAGTVIRVDANPTALETNAASTVAIAGDAAAVATAIAEALPSRADRARVVAESIAAATAAIQWPTDVGRFLPAVQAIDAALPRDRIVCVDSTQLGYAANHALDVYVPGSWLMPIGFGCLGPALPMAIGSKLAEPNRPVAAIVGDGGLLFTLQELATGLDHALPIPVIVWNNAGYGEIRDAMSASDMPAIGTDASAHDITAIARGFGCHADRPSNVAALSAAITAALAADRPTVIELTPKTEGILNAH